MYEQAVRSHMGVVDSHEDRTGDEEEDPEESVRGLEGHAGQINEYQN